MMRTITVAAAVFLLVASASLAGTSASQPKTRWHATVAALPSDAATGENQQVGIGPISCSSPGNCSAVGTYVGKTGDQEGLLLTEKAGRWARGLRPTLPASAAAGTPVNLTAVSCPADGTCTAVGSFDGSGLLLTEKGGHWRRGVNAPLPSGAGWVSLYSVSCASAGNCTAVGDDNGRGLVLTEKAGRWARGRFFGRSSASIDSVSCASDGSCSAVGYDNWQSGDRNDGPTGDALVLSKKNGKWRRANPSDLGASEGNYLGSVSCVPRGNCSATVLYNISIDNSNGPYGMLLNEKAGKWVGAVDATPPNNANAGASVYLDDVSCAAPGDCLAVGVAGNEVTLLTEKGGNWQNGVEAGLPRGGQGGEPYAVSCSSPGNCTAVGTFFGTSSGNSVAGPWGLLLTEIGGRWEPAVKAPLFRGSFDSVDSVSCTSPGNCSAVGSGYFDGGPTYGVLLDSTTP